MINVFWNETREKQTIMHVYIYPVADPEGGGAPERLERKNVGLWSGLEREMGVSGADL